MSPTTTDTSGDTQSPLSTAAERAFYRRFLSIFGPVAWPAKLSQIEAVIRNRFPSGDPAPQGVTTFSAVGPRAFSVSAQGVAGLIPENATFDGFSAALETIDDLVRLNLISDHVGFSVAKHFIMLHEDAAEVMLRATGREVSFPPLAGAKFVGGSIRQVVQYEGRVANFYFENDFRNQPSTLHVVTIGSASPAPWTQIRPTVITTINEVEDTATAHVLETWQRMVDVYKAPSK